MRSPEHRLAALALTAFAVSASGCTGEELDAPPEATEELRLGRVHVVLEPEADPDVVNDSEAFEISARFAFVRGLDQDFVRARIDMPLLATDVVQPSDCVVTDTLVTVEPTEIPQGELLQLRLVDAGDIAVRIGNHSIDLPLMIRPDLLPYMSGLEYLYVGEEAPRNLDADGGARVTVDAKGSQTDEFPPFRAEGIVPAPLGLDMSEADQRELANNALVLRWQAADEDELITVRLTGLQGGDPVGADLTCVLDDVGQTALDFGRLQTLGLMLDAESLRVTASRLQQTQFDAGDFVGSELFIERREQLIVPLP